MYLLLALLSGVVLSVMISFNGNLTAQYGTFPAAAIIHLVGTLSALLLCALRKEKRVLRWYRPWWIYLGGAIGVLTTVCQNFAFGHISVTSIVALGMLGQTCLSLLVDRFGLLGMQKQPAARTSWLGVALVLIGVAVMLDGTVAAATAAACVSFVSGVTVVLSRTVNARLAEKTGALGGSFINHLVGLPITVMLALIVTKGRMFSGAANVACKPWAFLGGVLGVALVLLCNLAVLRVSAFRMTLFGFVGQVFTGILIDILFGGGYAQASFYGGIIIALGICVNLLSERLHTMREGKRQAYYARIKQIETDYRDRILQRQFDRDCQDGENTIKMD